MHNGDFAGWVDISHRLVKEDERGFLNDGPCDHYLLLFAVAELVKLLSGQLHYADLPESFVHHRNIFLFRFSGK